MAEIAPPQSTSQTSRKESVPASRLQATFYLLGGLTIASVGLIDTLTISSLGNRLIGGLLATVGITIITGGMFLLQGWSTRGGELALATAGLMLGVGLAVLAAIHTNFTSQPRLIAAWCIVLITIVGSLLAGIANARRLLKMRGDTDVEGKGWLSEHKGAVIGAVATIMAALIAVPQVWYSSQYLPSTAPPVLSLKSTLSRPRPHSVGWAVTAEVEIKNTGSAPATVLASMYQIVGTEVLPFPGIESAQHLDMELVQNATEDNPGPSGRYPAFATYGLPTLIQFGQLVWDQAWLEPGEYMTATVVAFMPADRFDLLRLTTDIVFVRQDRVSVGDVKVVDTESLADADPFLKGCEGYHIQLASWAVEHETLFDRLTESDREVVTALVLGEDPDTTARTDADEESRVRQALAAARRAQAEAEKAQAQAEKAQAQARRAQAEAEKAHAEARRAEAEARRARAEAEKAQAETRKKRRAVRSKALRSMAQEKPTARGNPREEKDELKKKIKKAEAKKKVAKKAAKRANIAAKRANSKESRAAKAITEARRVGKDVIQNRWWPRFPEMYASIQHKGKQCGDALASTDRGLEDRSMFSVTGSVSEIDVQR